MTEEQRKRLNKYYDSLNLKPRRKPKNRVHIAIAPALTQAERDIQGVITDRIYKSSVVNNKMAKANIRGR